MATTKLTAPNGASVSVDSGKVDDLLRRGFTKPTEKKTPARKSASSRSSSTTSK